MNKADSNRLFFALWPEPAIRDQIEQQSRELAAAGRDPGRLIKPARYHMTLLFLGDAVSNEMQQAALRVAGNVSIRPFTLRLDCAGAFGRKQKIWWVGARDHPEELLDLHEVLQKGLGSCAGNLDKRRFRAHVTISRKASRKPPMTEIATIDWPVSEFVLMRSLNRDGSAVYERLASFPLAGGG